MSIWELVDSYKESLFMIMQFIFLLAIGRGFIHLTSLFLNAIFVWLDRQNTTKNNLNAIVVDNLKIRQEQEPQPAGPVATDDGLYEELERYINQLKLQATQKQTSKIAHSFDAATDMIGDNSNKNKYSFAKWSVFLLIII